MYTNKEQSSWINIFFLLSPALEWSCFPLNIFYSISVAIQYHPLSGSSRSQMSERSQLQGRLEPEQRHNCWRCFCFLPVSLVIMIFLSSLLRRGNIVPELSPPLLRHHFVNLDRLQRNWRFCYLKQNLTLFLHQIMVPILSARVI